MSLSAFLNPIKEENIDYIASKRFVDENGEAVKWVIKSITSEEDEAIRKSCTKKVQVPGKKGQFTMETDYESYMGKLAANCTVYPNLNDAELQNGYNTMGSDKLLKAMLKPGEYALYLRKVQEVNGYDEPLEDLVDEAKN